MTTLERARRFHKRIEKWAWYSPGRDWNHIDEHYAVCKARVARALIRQERDEAHRHAEKTKEQWDVGYSYGFQDALDILDAVYRSEK